MSADAATSSPETATVGFLGYLAYMIMAAVLWAVYYLVFGVVIFGGVWLVLLVVDGIRGTNYASRWNAATDSITNRFRRHTDEQPTTVTTHISTPAQAPSTKKRASKGRPKKATSQAATTASTTSSKEGK